MMMSDRLNEAMISLPRRRGAVILCFHQVDPQRFAGWMRLLSRHFRLVGLDELVERRTKGQSLATLLAVTFDDGWANTCEPIATICEREGWPITVYLVSSLYDAATTLWFAELPLLLEEAAGKRIAADGHVLELTQPSAARRTTKEVIAWLRTLPGDAAVDMIHQFRASAGLAPRTCLAGDFVDSDFVKRYASSQWITLGAHTVDHQALSAQSGQRLRWQLAESKARLEALAGTGIRHFCYPYGDREAIGELAPQLVRDLYRSATTMTRGVCAAHCDLWRLPRIPLYDSDSDQRVMTKLAVSPWL
jgi:peptidoglycan/xylan/chitin deacetylase (PgdA/CDA1 family)